MTPNGSANAPFTVTIQPSGRTFSTGQDETLLAAGIRQGVGLPYGCKDGACGSCKCQLISGEVRHNNYQPKALTAEELAGILTLFDWRHAWLREMWQASPRAVSCAARSCTA